MSDDVDVKQVEKGDSSEDRMNDLLDLIKNADPEKLKALAMLTNSSSITAEEKPKHNSQHGPVKTFTTIIKTSTCMLCRTVKTTRIELMKGERIHCTDEAGNVHRLISTGKVGELNVASIVSKCCYCNEVIKGWTREDLVKNFIRVKQYLTWKEIADYSKIVEDEG